MNRRRAATLAIAVLFLSSAHCRAQGNFGFEFNGLEAVSTIPTNSTIPTPPSGVGIWRCFERKMLYAPTKCRVSSDDQNGLYAAKITAIHVGLDVGVGCTPPPIVAIPYVLTGAGFASTGSSFNSTRYEASNVICSVSTLGPCTIATSGIALETLVSNPPVTVPEGEDLVVYVMAPVNTQFGVSDDETNAYGGSSHLVVISLAGASSPFAACEPATPFGAGGFGGPVLSNAIPENPRCACTISLSLISSPFWFVATTHGTAPGGINESWWTNPAGVSGATGNTGGFQITIPNIATLIGDEFCTRSVVLNPSQTAFAACSNTGHSNSMSHSFEVYP